MDNDNIDENSVQNRNNANEINNNENETLDKVKQEDIIESEANVENVEKVPVEGEESAPQAEKESIKSVTDQPNVEGQENENKEEEGAVEGTTEKSEKEGEQEVVEEEETFIEEPPPDPAAPLNLRDSTEALKPKFVLRPEQRMEVEQLWELFQAYNPAYTDLDNYITDKELVYMLKSLLLMTYTPEQLQELINYCVRPPHPEGHISFEQFLKIVTIRQRDLPIEDELRSALQALDVGKTGAIDREFFKDILLKQGNKLSPKLLDNFIKEVDLSNDGTIGIEDVVGTLCIDLNRDDIVMLLATLNPEAQEKKEEEF